MTLITITFLNDLTYQFLLRSCLNVFRLVVILVASEILFHNTGPMKGKIF